MIFGRVWCVEGKFGAVSTLIHVASEASAMSFPAGKGVEISVPASTTRSTACAGSEPGRWAIIAHISKLKPALGRKKVSCMAERKVVTHTVK